MVDKTKDGATLAPDADARRSWLEENTEAFSAQAAWHARHPHPLSDLIVEPRKPSSWVSQDG
ncbi:hypothetical protein [Phaeovulum veldkampii]|uniref:hypothetical protein n=1 Tax=Phaeovulum veldkampii TaxID=33049 RepID=UPI001062310D|nr:hypothetical protein [Phaeovulum veldkampii]TDQ54571.1 hypothetical protein EV658_1311 [Phaeovulum veldkampii DSM 11550]